MTPEDWINFQICRQSRHKSFSRRSSWGFLDAEFLHYNASLWLLKNKTLNILYHWCFIIHLHTAFSAWILGVLCTYNQPKTDCVNCVTVYCFHKCQAHRGMQPFSRSWKQTESGSVEYLRLLCLRRAARSHMLTLQWFCIMRSKA